ncbi:MAG: hypothetical protein M3440_06980, partial [Chloroflexota bacterium]|nr:hypothetical protein [Chloroflexota bacterium]
MATKSYTYQGLASELDGKPVKQGDTVNFTAEQVEVLRAHGHSFAEDADQVPLPTPQQVDAAFDVNTGEADL